MKKTLHVLVAIDSFKGSLRSLQAGSIVKQAILDLQPEAEVDLLPLADGGEGTMETLVECCDGHYEQVDVSGPLGAIQTARYGLLPDGMAVMEVAEVSGLPQVPPELRNPLNTTTFGLGELILHALEKGSRRFLIGLGGSATNDGGIGMLQALGARFLRRDGSTAGICGRDLEDIASIDLFGLDARLIDCEFLVACDVDNPLCGAQGASAVFGPQKGATPEIVAAMDEALRHYAELVQSATGTAFLNAPGAGAAGGLGFAFLSFLHTRLEPGISLIESILNIREHLQGKDFLVTGEGKLDHQTCMGKGPYGIASLAKEYGIVTIAVAGSVFDPQGCEEAIDACFSIQQAPISLEEAIRPKTASENLYREISQIFRLIFAVSNKI